MKLLCPNCGLGGTAPDELFGRKVRCPECKKVFLIAEEVVVGLRNSSSNIIEQSWLDNDKETDDENAAPHDAGGEVLDPEATQESAGTAGTGLDTCSNCGFSFSTEFMKVLEGKALCPACAG